MLERKSRRVPSADCKYLRHALTRQHAKSRDPATGHATDHDALTRLSHRIFIAGRAAQGTLNGMRRPVPARPNRGRRSGIPVDAYDYMVDRVLRSRATMSGTPQPLRAVDDWPERVPVTDAEIDIFEAFFGDVLDELFGE